MHWHPTRINFPPARSHIKAAAMDDQLRMDGIVRDRIGDLEGFIQFLSSSWGWSIRYSDHRRALLVDENRDECVCPVAKSRQATMQRIPCAAARSSLQSICFPGSSAKKCM